MDGDSRVDSQFKKISDILRKDIICNYRNILHVYSASWLSIDQINGISISKTRKRNAPSFVYGSHTIILIKLLREWINNTNGFVVNIVTKLSYQ